VSRCPARSAGPATGRGDCYRQSRRLARPAIPPAKGPSGFCLVWVSYVPSFSLDTGSKLWDRATPKALF
jgi:hypothetical protein